MEFRKYMHLERFGNEEVQGIELGKCYIFPKLDGTNASIWNDNDELQAGSRNRSLSIENDNAGFFQYIKEFHEYKDLIKKYPSYYFYGEWLVPHSLKIYREDAWRKFYIFDVYDSDKNRYLSYDEYSYILSRNDIEYIRPLCIIKNASYDNLLKELEKNTYLIKDGSGPGEGIVIKNYEYNNKYERVCWAKFITNKFKEEHIKEMGEHVRIKKEMLEQRIVDKYVTKHLVDKVYSKIVNNNEGWNSKFIPQLLNTIFYDLIKEESWDFIKEEKFPTINFKTLQTICTLKIKSLRNELF